MGDCLGRETVSPTRLCRDLGEEETRKCDRGCSVELHNPIDEADGAAGTRFGVPVDEGISGPVAHRLARAAR